MQGAATSLACADGVYGAVAEIPGQVLGYQDEAGCPVADGRAIKEPQGPGNYGVSPGVVNEIHLISPGGHRFPSLSRSLQPSFHDFPDGAELSLGIKAAVVMVLDGYPHEMLLTGPKRGDIGAGRDSEDAGEGYARGGLIEGIAGSSQGGGHFFRGGV